MSVKTACGIDAAVSNADENRQGVLNRATGQFYHVYLYHRVNYLTALKLPVWLKEKQKRSIIKKGLTQKKKTVKKAVMFLEIWKSFMDEIKKIGLKRNSGIISIRFSKNTSEGFYPIPQTLFASGFNTPPNRRFALWGGSVFAKNIVFNGIKPAYNPYLKIHSRYNDFLIPNLKGIGYIEKSPYGYSNAPEKTTCYHWEINGGKFI